MFEIIYALGSFQILKYYKTVLQNVSLIFQVQEINLHQRTITAKFHETDRHDTRYPARILYSISTCFPSVGYDCPVLSFRRCPRKCLRDEEYWAVTGNYIQLRRSMKCRSSFNRTENYKFSAEFLRRDDVFFGRLAEWSFMTEWLFASDFYRRAASVIVVIHSSLMDCKNLYRRWSKLI